jgi:Na+/proline symporter
VTVETINDARKSLVLKGVFTLVICTLFFLVGTGLYVYYQQYHSDIYDTFSAGGGKDQLLPHFVVHYAGGYGMTGLILAGLFAAAMSSLDSGINSMTASLVTDWYRGQEMGTTTNRCLTAIFGISVIIIACLLSLIDKGVFDILLSIAGATLGLLLSVLMMGMLISRANTIGVLTGAISGLLMFLCIRVNALSNRLLTILDNLAPSLHRYLLDLQNNTWWDGMFTTVTAVSVGIVVSYLTAPPRPEQLQGLLLRNADKTHPTVAN